MRRFCQLSGIARRQILVLAFIAAMISAGCDSDTPAVRFRQFVSSKLEPLRKQWKNIQAVAVSLDIDSPSQFHVSKMTTSGTNWLIRAIKIDSGMPVWHSEFDELQKKFANFNDSDLEDDYLAGNSQYWFCGSHGHRSKFKDRFILRSVELNDQSPNLPMCLFPVCWYWEGRYFSEIFSRKEYSIVSFEDVVDPVFGDASRVEIEIRRDDQSSPIFEQVFFDRTSGLCLGITIVSGESWKSTTICEYAADPMANNFKRPVSIKYYHGLGDRRELRRKTFFLDFKLNSSELSPSAVDLTTFGYPSPIPLRRPFYAGLWFWILATLGISIGFVIWWRRSPTLGS